MKERTLMYRFNIRHIPGNKNTAANTLSRSPLKICNTQVDEEDIETESITEMSVKAVIAGIAIAEDVLAMDLDELTRVASTDPLYNKLLNKIKSNTFAKTSALADPDVRPFFNVRDRICIIT